MMRVLLAVLALLYPGHVWAESCTPQDYTSTTAPNFECPSPEEEALTPNLSPPPAIPVHTGECSPAPWDGALVHRDRLVLLGLKLQAVRRLRWSDTLRFRALYTVELNHARREEELVTRALEEQVVTYRERALQAEQRTGNATAWYRSWWFGFVLGVVSAGGLVALAAYVVTAL